VFAGLEEGVAFAFIEFLEIENVLIECDSLLYVVDLDGDVIDSIDLDAHASFYRPLGLNGCSLLGVEPAQAWHAESSWESLLRSWS
jgi:hypothetical protein